MGQIILIEVVGTILSLGIAILSFAFTPYHLWELKFSFFWLVLVIVFSGLVCIFFTQVYPMDSTITLRKAIFSIPTGFFLFCLVWSLNSFEYKNASVGIFVVLLSMLFKGFGGTFLGYGTLSFIIILLGEA